MRSEGVGVLSILLLDIGEVDASESERIAQTTNVKEEHQIPGPDVQVDRRQAIQRRVDRRQRRIVERCAVGIQLESPPERRVRVDRSGGLRIRQVGACS